MTLARRTFLRSTGAVAASLFGAVATAQPWPARPITMIVPYPPGGPTDVLARVLAEQMRGALGQPIIIENVGGAEGSIGVTRAARAKGDGYTIELGAMSTHILNAAFHAFPFDILNDFAPILPLVTTPQILIGRNTIPANDLMELIAWLRANPAAASVGIGAAISHLVAAVFQQETGTHLTKVPYRTANVAMQDLVAGQIDLVFTTPDRLAMVRSGVARAFAVTSDRRLSPCPDVPTFAEAGLPALSISPWFALYAPVGTPKDIITRLNGAAAEALADPTVRSRVVQLGMEIFPREQQTPEALGALQQTDAKRWWPFIKAADIRRE
ncbi:MAG: tripartite tricarboxylate transporter substrate binding protein BugD [Bradyrhizobiaceae bacterium]|nr:tripartite tricarboxylate transporter substrate binding protein BugD [Bradyrhizobiaceae bacterium]